MRRTLFVLSLFAGACGADDPAPIVTVLSVTPDTLSPDDDLLDDVRILVRYEDPDGDLGEGTAQVHDCRGDELRTDLLIPAIAPDGLVADGAKITGSLDLHVTDVGAFSPTTLPAVCEELGVAAPAANETVFCVVLVDAKGHEGPGDCTTTVELVVAP